MQRFPLLLASVRRRVLRRRPFFPRWAGWLLLALAGQEAFPPVPARAGEFVLSWEELDDLLVQRHAFSEDGRFALEHLVKTALLGHLARERGMEVEPSEIAARWSELDRAAREQGGVSLVEEIRAKGLTPEKFRALLRLSIVHERLTREALGLPLGAEVTGDQQSVWIEQQIEELGLSMPPPPWEDGVAARCGPVEVPVERYLPALRSALAPADVREACMQLLLVKALRARMPDLAPEAEAEAVAREIRRREEEAAQNPKYRGVEFEALLRAQGMQPAGYSRDPAVVAAALATLWVDRTYGEEGLRATYEADRPTFESLYGEAVLAHVLFLSALRRPNQLQERSLEEAQKELLELAGGVEDLEEFTELAEAHSEDPLTREAGGRLGWVTRGSPRVPASLRTAIFDRLDAGGPLPEGGTLVGPLPLENGAALLWLADHRPSPAWEEMKVHVHRELRRRFADEALPADSVETYLDVE